MRANVCKAQEATRRGQSPAQIIASELNRQKATIASKIKVAEAHARGEKMKRTLTPLLLASLEKVRAIRKLKVAERRAKANSQQLPLGL